MNIYIYIYIYHVAGLPAALPVAILSVAPVPMPAFEGS